jgi:hypothetical protein
MQTERHLHAVAPEELRALIANVADPRELMTLFARLMTLSNLSDNLAKAIMDDDGPDEWPWSTFATLVTDVANGGDMFTTMTLWTEGHPHDDQAEWRRVTLELLRILFRGSLERAAAWFSRHSSEKVDQASDAITLYEELAPGSIR